MEHPDEQQEWTPRRPDDLSIAGLEAMTLRISEDGTIVYANSSFARYSGYTKEELIGQKISFLENLFTSETLVTISTVSREDEANRIVHDRRGNVFEYKTTAHGPFRDIVIQDVTNLHRLEGFISKYIYTSLKNLTDDDLRTFKFPERREMSVSFSDMRGFTAMSERMEPEEVREVINAYLEEAIRAIHDNKATVDKIVGDEVMGLYGAPRYYQDHALRAVKTACDQMAYLRELQIEFARSGRIMPEIGIGLNTGEMVVGNIGSSIRQDYTVLGSSVNIAARLCSAARGGEILLTEQTLEEALKSLPEDWEILDAQSEAEIDLTEIGGKTEGVFPLPEELQKKVVLVGPNIENDFSKIEFCFYYMYCLKAKGIEEPFPVLCVTRPREWENTLRLNDDAVLQVHNAQVFGKYRLLEKIGIGGMGEIWRAKDGYGRQVAIKMLRVGEGATESQIKRFRREAEIMMRLESRNIVRIFEVGEYDKNQFIAMEYIDGASLDKILGFNASAHGTNHPPSSDLVSVIKAIQESHSSAGNMLGVEGEPVSPEHEENETCLILPQQQTISIIIKICEAIQSAHEAGVLHRDLKPGNVMVRSDGEPLVMDFGLAKMAEQHQEMSLSLSGEIMGTIEYMAPEQARSSKEVDERADVYSIGAILYKMLTGQKHYHSSGNILADAEALQQFVAKRPRLIDPKIESDLEIITLKALRADPQERYRNARALREDLERYQRGEVILAKDVSVMEAGTKWVKRNKVLASVIAGFLLIGLVGTTIFVWQLQGSLKIANDALADARIKEKELKDQKAVLEATLQKYEDEKTAKGEAILKLTEAEKEAKNKDERTFAFHLSSARDKAVHQDWASAEKEMEMALALKPDNREAYLTMARICAAHFDLKESADWINKANLHAPADSKSAFEALVERYLPRYSASKNPADDTSSIFKFAEDMKDTGQPDDAWVASIICSDSGNRKSEISPFSYIHSYSLNSQGDPLPPEIDQALRSNTIPGFQKFYGYSKENQTLHIYRHIDATLASLRALELKIFRFADCKFTDLKEFAGLSIEELDLSGSSSMRDISAIKGISKLQTLNIANTSVTDLSPLTDSAIKTLVVGSDVKMNAAFFEPLVDSQIEKLGILTPNQLPDLSFLAKMKNLKSLALTIGPLHDLSSLHGTSIKSLSLTNTKVSDLSPLSELQLTDLDISNSPVTDLSPLKDMKLSTFAFTGDPSGLAALKDMPLEYLQFDPTHLSKDNVEILRNLSGIKAISLNENSPYIPPSFFWKNYDTQQSLIPPKPIIPAATRPVPQPPQPGNVPPPRPSPRYESPSFVLTPPAGWNQVHLPSNSNNSQPRLVAEWVFPAPGNHSSFAMLKIQDSVTILSAQTTLQQVLTNHATAPQNKWTPIHPIPFGKFGITNSETIIIQNQPNRFLSQVAGYWNGKIYILTISNDTPADQILSSWISGAEFLVP